MIAWRKSVSIPRRYAKNEDRIIKFEEMMGFQSLVGTLKTPIEEIGKGSDLRVSIPRRYAKNSQISFLAM